VNRLRAFLRRHASIALDTSVFIYALEDYPRYADLAIAVLTWVAEPGHKAVTSTITMTEVLVRPYAAVGGVRVNQTYLLLLAYPNLTWVSADLEIAVLAARFRASYKLKTPDALLAATAVRSGATGLVTDDAGFERIQALETLTLDRLL
jgi:predicted nucleic acid-binding protein